MDHADHLINYFAEIPMDARLGILEKLVAHVPRTPCRADEFIETIDERQDELGPPDDPIEDEDAEPSPDARSRGHRPQTTIWGMTM
jgi:hypothetical protein